MRAGGPEAATRLTNRLVDMICDKLGQLNASGANVVLIGIDSDGMYHIALQSTLKTLRQDADPVWCDNPLAKHSLPARVKTALIRSHTLI